MAYITSYVTEKLVDTVNSDFKFSCVQALVANVTEEGISGFHGEEEGVHLRPQIRTLESTRAGTIYRSIDIWYRSNVRYAYRYD